MKKAIVDTETESPEQLLARLSGYWPVEERLRKTLILDARRVIDLARPGKSHAARLPLTQAERLKLYEPRLNRAQSEIALGWQRKLDAAGGKLDDVIDRLNLELFLDETQAALEAGRSFCSHCWCLLPGPHHTGCLARNAFTRIEKLVREGNSP